MTDTEAPRHTPRHTPRRSGRHQPTLIAAVALVLVVIAAACASSTGSRESSGDIGADAYATSCSACHGADLRGSSSGPSLLSIVYEPGHHPDESFRSAITNGVQAHHWDFGPMPMITRLSTSEIDAVIAFVRNQQETYGFEEYPPPG